MIRKKIFVYYNIATVHHNKSNWNLDLADIYNGVGQVYEKRHDFKNAFVQFEKDV